MKNVAPHRRSLSLRGDPGFSRFILKNKEGSRWSLQYRLPSVETSGDGHVPKEVLLFYAASSLYSSVR